ncbi:MAG: acylphosphatase [Alphaproteobacteria bacterium]|nr:acylphosphatase [Alphaproteobacteria bacterium]
MSAKSVRVRITGRVQGVWYRGWTVDQARGLGLSGWVRNRRDGSVEAVFAGTAAAVDDMLARCREGPSAARVDDIAVAPAAPPAGVEFRQLPTE